MLAISALPTKVTSRISTMGLKIKLCNSQKENHLIIKNHWKTFNLTIKKHHLQQENLSWIKYGITYKENNEYFYLAAIPQSNNIIPEEFIIKEIPIGNYLTFNHIGKLSDLINSFHQLYKVIIPENNIKIANHEYVGFLHFEKYDHRFNWNKPESIIEIHFAIN